MAAGTPRQQALAQAATGFIGQPQIKVRGRRFAFDCTGLVRGVYLSQGVDLYGGQRVSPIGLNGVRFIHQYVKRHGRLHSGPTVHPGDLVFFHNTWDANGDYRLNDRLTHVGVVEWVTRDGTVVFASRVWGGVRHYRMNLRMPGVHRTRDGRLLNDFVRRKGFLDLEGTQYLTGQLFATFGTLLH
jgi:cell wall-associated NlpC family hydrolase